MAEASLQPSGSFGPTNDLDDVFPGFGPGPFGPAAPPDTNGPTPAPAPQPPEPPPVVLAAPPAPVGCLDCNASFVSDQSVIFSCYAGLFIGFISIIGFSLLWRHVKVYTSRQRLRHVAFKPPVVPTAACFGFQKFWGWLVPVLFTPTEDIFHAAGFDAVVMLKTLEFGVQLFTPLAIVALVVLVPVHLEGNDVVTAAPGEGNRLAFVRFTIANLRSRDRGDPNEIYWLHFVLAYVFVFYALWLIRYHYQSMCELRRRHNIAGEDHHFMQLLNDAEHPLEGSGPLVRAHGDGSPPYQAPEQQTVEPAVSRALDAMGRPVPDAARHAETSLLDSWNRYQQNTSPFLAEEALGPVLSTMQGRNAMTMTLDPTIDSPTSIIAQDRRLGGVTAELGAPMRASTAALGKRGSDALRLLRGGHGGATREPTGLGFTDLIQESARRPRQKASPSPSLGGARTSISQLSQTFENPMHRAPQDKIPLRRGSRDSSYAGRMGDPARGSHDTSPRPGHSTTALDSRASNARRELTVPCSAPLGSLDLDGGRTYGASEEVTATLPGKASRSLASRPSPPRQRALSTQASSSGGGGGARSSRHAHQLSFADMAGPPPQDLLSADLDPSSSGPGPQREASMQSLPSLRPRAPPQSVSPVQLPARASSPGQLELAAELEQQATSVGAQLPGSAPAAGEPETPTIARPSPRSPVSEPSAGPATWRQGKPPRGPVAESHRARRGSSGFDGSGAPAAQPSRGSPFEVGAAHPPEARASPRGTPARADSGRGEQHRVPGSPGWRADGPLLSHTPGVPGDAEEGSLEGSGSESATVQTRLFASTQSAYVPQGGGAASAGQATRPLRFRPAPLHIDHPADAVSLAGTSSAFPRGATGAGAPSVMGGDTGAVPAIANDITVIDADQTLANQERAAAAAAASATAGPCTAASAAGIRPEGPTPPAAAKPVKWWEVRGRSALGGEQLDSLLMNKSEYPSEAWERMWFDHKAIMSRKPSVRFRRTVDIRVPTVNEHGEPGMVRRAIEVQKYCILVTDIPIFREARLLEMERREAEEQRQAESGVAATGSAADGLSSRPSSRLNPKTLSLHAGGAASEPPHSVLSEWMSKPAPGMAREDGVLSSARASTDGSPSLRPPQTGPSSEPQVGLQLAPLASAARATGGSAAPRVASGGASVNGFGRAGRPVAEGTCVGAPLLWPGAASAQAHALEAAPEPSAAGQLRAWLSSHLARRPRRSDGATDLRCSEACEALAARLCHSAVASAGVIEGEEGRRVWRSVMERASVPPGVERVLCDWVDSLGSTPQGSSGTGTALSDSDSAASVSEFGTPRAVPRPQGPWRRQNAARAVGEAAESGLAAHDGRQRRVSTSERKGLEQSRVDSGRDESNANGGRAAASTVHHAVNWFDAEEATFKRGIAVDAAEVTLKPSAAYAADLADGDTPVATDADNSRHALRTQVTNKVAYAFDLIFHDAQPRLVPVLNHKRVHLQLQNWDRLHQRLELIEAKEDMMRRKALKAGSDFHPLTHRTGFLGCCGERVESRKYYLERIAMTEELIDRERNNVLSNGVAASYFVIFETQFAAAVAAQAVLHSEDARLYRTRQAPGPDNVNWPALWQTREGRQTRRPISYLMYALVMCIPLGIFAGILSQLAEIICETSESGSGAPSTAATGSGPSVFCNSDSFLQRIVTQLMPAVLVILWQNAVMPNTLYSITLFESTHTSLSSLDRRILMLFFWWDTFNIFVGSMLAGSISQHIQDFIKAPGTISDTLGQSLPISSNFFINYIALRAFGLVPFRLILVHGGIWRWLFKCGGKCGNVITERDAAGFMAPASIRYGRELGVTMLVFITGWAYAVVSPLVVVVAAIYFMSSWVVWRWQIMYVYVRCYEGGGSLWRSIISCFMWCLLIFVFFTSCVFIAKQAFYQAAILFVTLPIVILRFWSVCAAKYDPALKYVPLEATVNAPRAKINDMSYVAAPLRPKCSGWHPEWGKAWESWGSPSYVFS